MTSELAVGHFGFLAPINGGTKLWVTENRLHIYKRPCCTPTGADPDTNRSAGLHSLCGFGHDCRRIGLVEFAGCRSDLSYIFESTSIVEEQGLKG